MSRRSIVALALALALAGRVQGHPARAPGPTVGAAGDAAGATVAPARDAAIEPGPTLESAGAEPRIGLAYPARGPAHTASLTWRGRHSGSGSSCLGSPQAHLVEQGAA